MIGQSAGGSITLLIFVFRNDRHKGLRKCALGEQPTQEVGDAEGNEKSVGVDRGAESSCYQELADQPCDA